MDKMYRWKLEVFLDGERCANFEADNRNGVVDLFYYWMRKTAFPETRYEVAFYETEL